MTGIAFVQPGQHIQRMQTVYRRFTDQHGRVFAAQSDIRNSQPKEELRPVNDDPRHTFSPPWLPPMRFAIFTDGSMDFRWDYDTMATELSGDAANYYQDAMEFALEHNLPMPEMGGTVDKKIILLKGKPPLSPAIPLACEQGEPWMLGKPGAVVNETLQQVLTQGVQSNSKAALDIIKKALADMAEKNAIPLVAAKANPADKPAEKIKTINDVDLLPEITYQQFVSECRGRKMKLPDIAAAWQEHKRNMLANDKAGA
jgi:hypothetical protein